MISKLTVENFGSFENVTEFDFGSINRITGANGEGKSTIGKSMLWALTGLNLGAVAAGGEYQKKTDAPSRVSLVINGVSFERSRSKSGTTSIRIDHSPAKEEHCEAFTKAPSLAFATMFWPEIFFRLTPQKQRDVFMSVAPKADLQALFRARSGENPDLINWTDSPRKQFEFWNLRRLNLEKELAHQSGRIFEIKNQSKEAPKPELIGQLKAAREDLQKAYTESCKQEKIAAGIEADWIRYETHLEAFRKAVADYDAIVEFNARVRKSTDTTEARRLAEAEEKLTAYQVQLRAAEEVIASAQAKGRAIMQAIKEQKEICPTCGQKIVVDKEARQRDFESAKESAAKANESKAMAEKNIAKLTEEISHLRKQLAAMGGGTTEKPFPIVPDEPVAPSIDRIADSESIQKKSRELATAIGAATAEITNIESAINVAAKNETAKLEIEKEIVKLKIQYEQAKRIESALHLKTGIYADALKEQLSKVSLPGYRFIFSETQANGEERETFAVLRESDNRAVESLSSGERIKFCMAVSKLIADLSCTPVRMMFLERADLLDKVPAVPGFQVFAERVTKEGQLKVEVLR